MGEVELSCRAYVKMHLHACVFPRCSINGLLLSSGSAGGAVCVTDCVPLLHSHLPLAPISQLALTQVKDAGVCVFTHPALQQSSRCQCSAMNPSPGSGSILLRPVG